VTKTRTTLLCLLALLIFPGCVSWDPIVLPGLDFLRSLFG
jgi:hypothetical protein